MSEPSDSARPYELFRPEVVVDAAKAVGSVSIMQPITTKLVAWLVTATLTLTGVWLTQVKYPTRLALDGYMSPTHDTVHVPSLAKGIVTAIYVSPGDPAAKGQVLAKVEAPLSVAETVRSRSGLGADAEDVDFAPVTFLTSPYDGTVAAIGVETGSEVGRNDPVFTILTNRTPRGVVLLPSHVLPVAREGAELTVSFPARPLSGNPIRGVLTQISDTPVPRAGAKTSATEATSYTGYVRFVDAQERADGLRSPPPVFYTSGATFKATMVVGTNETMAEWLFKSKSGDQGD